MESPALSIGITPAEAEHVEAAAGRLLPASLASAFDANFARSDRLFDEYVSRLTLKVVASTGIGYALATWGTAGEIVARAGLDARSAPVPVAWMLRRLAERNAIEAREGSDGLRFRAARVHVLDASDVLEAQQRHDPSVLPSYTLATAAADAYPAFLQGTRSGEEILLAPARLALWRAYFSNDHSLYAVNNRVGAAAIDAWLHRGPNVVLELGAGMGSGTTAALAALKASGRLGHVAAYRVTDVVSTFLRYAERHVRETAKDVPGITFEKLDMNQPFAAFGIEPESVSIVYAVNTLHVAYDLSATLAEIRRSLRRDGQLIVSECVRPRPGQTLYPEFVFNMLATFRAPRLDPTYRPNGGFLTPEQWRAALEAAGFTGVRMLPDIAAVRDVVPYFSVGAIGATRPG
jgi:SAM-dependent methyltransferase